MTNQQINYLAQLHEGQWFGFDGDQIYENMWVANGYEKPTEQEIIDGADGMELKQWRESAVLPSRKFWLGLEFYPYNGSTMLSAVNSAIQQLQGQTKKKVEIELQRTHEFNRNGKSTLMMIQAIGMTPEQADEFFIWAENEEWDNL